MRAALVKSWLAGAALLAATASAGYSQSDENVNPDPVFVFNRICYAQVPDVQAIQTMATKLAWRAITKDELEEFKNTDAPRFLAGWDVQVGERLFRVGVTQSDVSDSLVASFPDFAEGVSTSCSLVLDDQQDPAVWMANLQSLVQKTPVSSDVDEGFFLTTTWAGGNADLKVFVFAKTPKVGQGGLLNVTLLQK